MLASPAILPDLIICLLFLVVILPGVVAAFFPFITSCDSSSSIEVWFEGLSSLNCFNDSKLGGVEEDRLGVEVVETSKVTEIGAVYGLGVIRWGEGEEGQWMGRLENTGILSEGLSFTDPYSMDCVILQRAILTFTNST